MATVATEKLSAAGLQATYAAASGGGDKVKATDDTFLHVKNAGGGSINVTLTTPGNVSGVAIDDPVIAVGAGAEAFIGPLFRHVYADGADNDLCSIAWSGTTSVTFAAVSL